MSNGLTINNENFEAEVLRSPIPVLLDFWAGWCGPCKMIGPVLDQLADEYAGRVKIGKIDVDAEADLAGRHGITSIPTLVVYRNGELVRQQTGAAPRQNIEALFKDLI